jgi:hypothetical protein
MYLLMPEKPVAEEETKMRLLKDVNGFDEWAEAVVSELEGRLEHSSTKPQTADDRRVGGSARRVSRPSGD